MTVSEAEAAIGAPIDVGYMPETDCGYGVPAEHHRDSV
jgi:hypothetical protein